MKKNELFLSSQLFLLALVLQDGTLDPLLVGLHLGVDAGHVRASAADAEADDADLIPLTFLLADKWASSVTLINLKVN
jgi:hypothetical protein